MQNVVTHFKQYCMKTKSIIFFLILSTLSCSNDNSSDNNENNSNSVLGTWIVKKEVFKDGNGNFNIIKDYPSINCNAATGKIIITQNYLTEHNYWQNSNNVCNIDIYTDPIQLISDSEIKMEDTYSAEEKYIIIENSTDILTLKRMYICWDGSCDQQSILYLEKE